MADLIKVSPIVEGIEQAFINAGQKAVMMWLVEQLPWLGGWFINPIAAYFAGLFAQFIIVSLDKVAFAAYVAVKLDMQVSDFIKAEASGDQQAIDQAGDDLIHMRNK